MPPRSDDPGQIVAGVEAAGVDRRPAIAQQQGTDLAFALRLRYCLVELDAAMWPQTHVTVGVDKTWNDPAAVKDGLRTADRFAAQEPVGDPPLHLLAVGQSPPAKVERIHPL